MAHNPPWMVVGLGNPEPDYANTRHNVGRAATRVLADRLGACFSRHRRVAAQVAAARHGDRRLVLVLPDGYMNESGDPVRKAVAWYGIPTTRLVVVHDDIDLPPGALRLKQGGGSGGHRGVGDLDRRLPSPHYYRVRIGVGRPPPGLSARDHVLRVFCAEEHERMVGVLAEAAEAVLMLTERGLEPAQNRYHTSTA